jgi:hypothetical protein
MTEQHHETIWLQPWCDGCDKHAYGSDGRMWCQDDVWGHCEECGRPPVKYSITADQSSPQVNEE